MDTAKPWNPRYPKLNPIAHSDRYGRIELLSVSETSDGFLEGWARVGEGEAAHEHTVFIGQAEDFK